MLGACKENAVQHIMVLGQVVANATLTFHDPWFIFPLTCDVMSNSISPEAGICITYDRSYRNTK